MNVPETVEANPQQLVSGIPGFQKLSAELEAPGSINSTGDKGFCVRFQSSVEALRFPGISDTRPADVREAFQPAGTQSVDINGDSAQHLFPSMGTPSPTKDTASNIESDSQIVFISSSRGTELAISLAGTDPQQQACEVAALGGVLGRDNHVSDPQSERGGFIEIEDLEKNDLNRAGNVSQVQNALSSRCGSASDTSSEASRPSEIPAEIDESNFGSVAHGISSRHLDSAIDSNQVHPPLEEGSPNSQGKSADFRLAGTTRPSSDHRANTESLDSKSLPTTETTSETLQNSLAQSNYPEALPEKLRDGAIIRLGKPTVSDENGSLAPSPSMPTVKRSADPSRGEAAKEGNVDHSRRALQPAGGDQASWIAGLLEHSRPADGSSRHQSVSQGARHRRISTANGEALSSAMLASVDQTMLSCVPQAHAEPAMQTVATIPCVTDFVITSGAEVISPLTPRSAFPMSVGEAGINGGSVVTSETPKSAPESKRKNLLHDAGGEQTRVSSMDTRRTSPPSHEEIHDGVPDSSNASTKNVAIQHALVSQASLDDESGHDDGTAIPATRLAEATSSKALSPVVREWELAGDKDQTSTARTRGSRTESFSTHGKEGTVGKSGTFGFDSSVPGAAGSQVAGATSLPRGLMRKGTGEEHRTDREAIAANDADKLGTEFLPPQSGPAQSVAFPEPAASNAAFGNGPLLESTIDLNATARILKTPAGKTSGDAFSAIDSSDIAVKPTWLHADAQRVEAGFLDPSLGWIGVRADTSGSSLHASVIPSSREAAEVLGAHLSGLNAFLNENHGRSSSATIASPEGHAGSFSGGQHAAQGEAQRHLSQSASSKQESNAPSKAAGRGDSTSSGIASISATHEEIAGASRAAAHISVLA